MLTDPRRAEEELAVDLAKVHSIARMRLGLVAGLVIVGLTQTHFNIPDRVDIFAQVYAAIASAGPVLGIAVGGVLLVVLLARRDMKRAYDRYESKRFRVPTRKTPGKVSQRLD